MEQRRLQRPGSPRRRVQRWSWSCPQRRRASFSAAGAQKAATTAARDKVDDAWLPPRQGGCTWPPPWFCRQRGGVDATLFSAPHVVDVTTIFGRTARARSKEPWQPAHMILTALARFARCTGFHERASTLSSQNGVVNSLSMMDAISISRAYSSVITVPAAPNYYYFLHTHKSIFSPLLPTPSPCPGAYRTRPFFLHTPVCSVMPKDKASSAPLDPLAPRPRWGAATRPL